MTTILKLWFGTLKATLTNIRALAIFLVIYAVLIASFLRFIWIREATLWQVVFTYVLMVLMLAAFFIFQAVIIDRVQDQKFRWSTILIDAAKFFVATIPVVLLGWLIHYLLTKWQVRFPPPVVSLPPLPSGTSQPQPTHWPSLFFATLRFVLLGIALPLTTIHLWIAMAGGETRAMFTAGAKQFVKRVGGTLARAFAFESVLIHGLGLIVWFILPWMILAPSFSLKGYKTALAAIIGQLLLAFFFNFVGWVVTISALTRNALEKSPTPSPDRSAAVAVEAAA